MRAFSQPPWDSPLAAIEQNSRKESSLSRISWNRLLAESIVGHLSQDAAGFRKERVKCGERAAATAESDNSAKRMTIGVTTGA
ncbi:hypothetical protein GCM10010321_61640 [Streptomyces chartreusis]|nr:hypothetical protein GCM10010321_61640 [Streptomyces chartreusis]